jgi:hypothetical protein
MGKRPLAEGRKGGPQGDGEMALGASIDGINADTDGVE